MKNIKIKIIMHSAEDIIYYKKMINFPNEKHQPIIHDLIVFFGLFFFSLQNVEFKSNEKKLYICQMWFHGFFFFVSSFFCPFCHKRKMCRGFIVNYNTSVTFLYGQKG